MENELLCEIVKNKEFVFLDNPVEVSIWCEYLKCTEKDLQNAVKKVGTLSDNVMNFLSALMF